MENLHSQPQSLYKKHPLLCPWETSVDIQNTDLLLQESEQDSVSQVSILDNGLIQGIIYADGKKARQLMPNSVNLLGFGFDGTACFRKGAKYGPQKLREVSFGIESYSPYMDDDLVENQLFDLGDLCLGHSQSVEEQYHHANSHFFQLMSGRDFVEENIKLLTIGGEHSISYAPIKTYLKSYPDLVLLHLDAHADLRDGYEGYHFSHASIIRRVLDHFEPTHSLIQYGIRSGTREEYMWMQREKTLCTSRNEFLEKVKNIDPKRPIYLTLDLDYFDPSFLPGTGTPEPGGEDFHSYISLLKILKTKNFVGADVVELAPDLDFSGNSSVFAAKVIRELALALNRY